MFRLKKPCKNCPFRNDVPSQQGWLGGRRAAEIYDTTRDGYVFACHKTLGKSDSDEDWDEDWEDDLDELSPQDDISGNCDNDPFKHLRPEGEPLKEHYQFCAGVLILLEKQGEAIQSNAIRMAERLGIYDHTKLDMESPVFDTRETFIAWHEHKKNKKG